MNDTFEALLDFPDFPQCAMVASITVSQIHTGNWKDAKNQLT